MNPVEKSVLKIVAVVILMFPVAAAYTFMKVRQWERWQQRVDNPRPLTDAGALRIVLLILATIVAAFLYFRAHFPH